MKIGDVVKVVRVRNPEVDAAWVGARGTIVKRSNFVEESWRIKIDNRTHSDTELFYSDELEVVKD